jgi:dihydropteroate synthase
MTDSAGMIWRYRSAEWRLGTRTLVMGILNVTPDSFFDGGRHAGCEAAVTKALQLFAEGADIVDVGGESSRPGAEPVSVEEEIARVIPVVRDIRRQTAGALSVDTTKAAVAEAALAAGADIINDISAGRHDPRMLPLIAATGAGFILMHMQGEPRTMQDQPVYSNVVAEIRQFFRDRRSACERAGIDPLQLVLDPGIGFGKNFDHNWTILKRVGDLCALGLPVLVGASRKRFLGEWCGRPVEDRLAASLAAATAVILNGASIIRVHDVKESCDVARVADRMRHARESGG